MRSLHVLHHSTPYLDGYCVRSKYIVDMQRSLGLDPVAVTSAQHELEMARRRRDYVPSETIDGSCYYRTPLPNPRHAPFALKLPFFRQALFMSALQRRIDTVLAGERVDVVHAHSPVLCGLPASRVARMRGLPFVYEVRGFWEDSSALKRGGNRRSLRYLITRSLETRVLRQADAVVSISGPMLQDIARRGVPEHRLFSVPNGVDTVKFAPRPRCESLARSLGVLGHPVVGFIGSFYAFEGLDILLRAVAALLETIPDVKLVLVGGGDLESDLPDLIQELGLGGVVHLVGRVPHQDVPRYYSVMDVLVYPRHRNRTTELVTPLKPLEAMAMKLPVVASDVGGLRELLGSQLRECLVEPGNPKKLAERLATLLRDSDLRERLGAGGLRYVVQERSWQAIAERYREVYSMSLRL